MFLGSRQIAGASVGAHIEAAKKKRRKSGKTVKSGPVLAPECVHLWNAFVRMAERRQSGMGPQPISFQEIVWYCRVFHERFELWEIGAITALDDAFFEARAEDKSNG